MTVLAPSWRLAAATLASCMLLASAQAVRAQITTQGALTTQQVQQLAPQLPAFAGSAANFESLVNGLSLGTPVSLTTVGTDGIARTVTFTPPGGLSALQVAQTLEAARQRLVTQGVAAPTGEQISATLMGGSLVTPLGTQAVTGVLPQAPAAAVDAQRGVLTAQQVQQLAPQLVDFAGSPANFQSLVSGLSLGTPVALTTLGPDGFTRTATFTPMGGFSAQQIAQTLEAARQQLITQGIATPTGEQIGVTLMAGNRATATGNSLAGTQVRAGTALGVSVQTTTTAAPAGSTSIGTRASQPGISTSASPFFGTSDSPVVNTSASPSVGTSNSPVLPNATTQAPAGAAASGTGANVFGAGASVGATIPRLGVGAVSGAASGAPNGPVSPAAQIQGRR
jgi:hypothetical protein